MKTLEAIRKSRGVTKVAVQNELGVSQPAYDRYERFAGEMRAKDLMKVCDFLGIEFKCGIFLPAEES